MFNDSVVLKDYPGAYSNLVKLLEPIQKRDKSWKRCYKASEHNYGSSAFHKACDSKGPTVVLVKVRLHIFGGYADMDWIGCEYLRCSCRRCCRVRCQWLSTPQRFPRGGGRGEKEGGRVGDDGKRVAPAPSFFLFHPCSLPWGASVEVRAASCCVWCCCYCYLE